MAALYGRLADEADPLKLVRRYEKLRSFNPDHPESHIALARAMLDAKLWGGCRTHLDSAGGDAPPARVCRLMAELEEGENGDMAAVRQWLLRASDGAPDPAWICADCGAASAGWTPTCSRCAALGTLDWKVPERALSVAPPASPAATLAQPDSAARAGDGAGDDTAANVAGNVLPPAGNDEEPKTPQPASQR